MTETTLERQLAQAATRPQRFGGVAVDPARMQENLLAIHADLDAPPEPRLARVLRRLGVPDLTVPLVTATPALRRSWFAAIAIAVLFSLSMASNATGADVDRIVVYLTLAPLVPLLGVALAFGRAVDPTHDLVVAAPRDTFSVFLIRSLTVLAASSIVLLLGSLALPSGGLFRVAWLLPAIALSSVTLAVSSRVEPRRVAIGLSVGWLTLVVAVVSASAATTMFGGATQVGAAVVAAGAGWFVYRRRGAFDAEVVVG